MEMGGNKAIFAQFKPYEINVPLHAVGCHFYKTINGEVTEVFLHKQWKIRTTHEVLHAELAKFKDVKLPPGCITEQVRGDLGRKSAIYPRKFTRHIWKAITKELSSEAQIEEEIAEDLDSITTPWSPLHWSL